MSRPAVIYKEEKGVRTEPFELLMIDVPGDYTGVVVEKLASRRGELVDMSSEGAATRLEFKIPARGLIGYRNEFMTDTKGNGVLNHVFCGYRDYAGDIPERQRGSIIAHERGETTAYGLYSAQERGRLFVVRASASTADDSRRERKGRRYSNKRLPQKAAYKHKGLRV